VTLPVPNASVELGDENFTVAPELSYSLGPLGDAGMAAWFAGLQYSIVRPSATPASSPTHVEDGHAEGFQVPNEPRCILPAIVERGSLLGWSARHKGMEVKVS
jgi:hypothetical protein